MPRYIQLQIAVTICFFIQLHSSNSQPELRCTKDEIRCDFKCLPGRWLCDGEADCSGGEDEMNCGNRTCRPDSVLCLTGGKCINIDWWCDGDKDCPDGSDENNCDASLCPETTLPCQAGFKRCFPSSALCDRQEDCTDGSDEINCEFPCPEDQLLCPNQTEVKCIKKTWWCDGEADCSEATDEADCRPTCTDKDFTCADGKCIKKEWHCDGDNDCQDNSDEENCPIVRCSQKEFMCADNTCISKRWLCDGEADCEDDSDEIGCPSTSSSTVVLTTTKHRYPQRKKSTGSTQSITTSSSTTLSSVVPTTTKRRYPQRTKTNRPKQSIRKTGPSTSSETVVPTTTKLRYPQRTKSPSTRSETVVPTTAELRYPQRTNSIGPTQSSRKTTVATTPRSCRPNTFACDNICIPKRWVCDSTKDCPDGSDEQNCNTKTSSQRTSTIISSTSTTTSSLEGMFTETSEDPLLLSMSNYTFDVLKLSSGWLKTADLWDKADNLHYPAIAVDVRRRNIYWADIKHGMIESASLRADLQVEYITTIFYTNTTKTPTALACDWVHQNLYWSDSTSKTISVGVITSEKTSILIDSGLEEVRGLAVDPENGWLYWTNRGSHPKIEKCGTDGTHRKILIDKNLDSPYDIALDYNHNVLYWTSSGSYQLGMCDLVREQCRPIRRFGEGVRLASVDIFQHNIFFVEEGSSKIQTMNRKQGTSLRDVHTNITHPGGIVIFHSDRQRQSLNKCGKYNGGCEICLPSPTVKNSTRKYSCACPDGLYLQEDGKTCTTRDLRCFKGYAVKDNRCADQDECVIHPRTCNHICINTIGSFRCACHDGYGLISDTRCATIDEPFLLTADSRNFKRIDLQSLTWEVVDIPRQFHKRMILSFDFDVRRHLVFWIDRFLKTINMARINGKKLEQPTKLLSNATAATGIAYDWIHRALYWTRESMDKPIMMMALESRLPLTLLNKTKHWPRGLALDPANGWLYWTEWGHNASSIQRCGMDGSMRQTLYTTQLLAANGITIDYIAPRLYWCDAYVDKIQSSDLDGRNVRYVIEKPGEHMYSLTFFEHYIYWTDWISKTIRRLDMRTARRQVIDINGSIPTDVKVFHKVRQPQGENRCGENHGCFICLPSPQKVKYRCACPDGYFMKADQKTCAILGGRGPSCGKGLVARNGKCEDDNECQRGTCSHGCVNTHGSYRCTCPDGYALVNDTQCHMFEPVTATLLVMDKKLLTRVDLETANVTSVLVAAETSQATPTALDYDFKKRTIYWTDYRETGIYKAKMVIRNNIIRLRNKEKLFWRGIRDPQGIAIDWVHQNIYWSDLSAHKLQVASLLTKENKTLLDKDLEYIRGIAVDPRYGWLYWASWGARPQISRCGMDGSNREVLINTKLDTPNDIAIDYYDDRFYWIDGWSTKIGSCDLNGKDCGIYWSSKERIMIFSIDVFKGNVYWNQWKPARTRRFNATAGIPMDIILDNGHQPTGISVVHPERQPYSRNRCGSDNGGCLICLPTPPVEKADFRCACPDDLYVQSDGRTCGENDPSWPVCEAGFEILEGVCQDVNECVKNRSICDHKCINTNGSYSCACRVGYTLEDKKCVPSNDAFVVLVDHVHFRRMNLSTHEFRRLKVTSRFTVERPVALDFDISKSTLFWSDLVQQSINIASMDGLHLTNARELITSGATNVQGLAYDWVHSNLFWVDTLEDNEAIRVLSLNNMVSKTLLNRYLGTPRGIAVHPNESLIFWTNWAEDATIERCGMDGTGRQVIVNDAIQWPNGITIDYGEDRLYWTDAGLETLTSSLFDGSDRRIIFKKGSSLKEHLFSVSQYGDSIFWTDWITRSLRQADKRTGHNMTSYNLVHRPLDMKIFHSSRQIPYSNVCETNQCSHLCLPSPDRTTRLYLCACPDDMLLSRDNKNCIQRYPGK